MIKYALVCKTEHEFESWFPHSDAFEKQAKRGMIACPICNSTAVSKAIMSPSVARKDRLSGHNSASVVEDLAGESAEVAVQPLALLDDRAVALRKSIRELRSKIMANAVDVGSNFPEEARKMHDGDAPVQSIYGQASLAEARELLEDGIPLLPIPDLPEDRN